MAVAQALSAREEEHRELTRSTRLLRFLTDNASGPLEATTSSSTRPPPLQLWPSHLQHKLPLEAQQLLQRMQVGVLTRHGPLIIITRAPQQTSASDCA